MKTFVLQNSKSATKRTNKIPKQLSDIASIHQGKCLSRVYKTCKEKLLWQCSCGHQWLATPFSIKIRKSWCPVCAGNQPLGLKAMHKLATENEGKCLSTIYENCKTIMMWQCKFGHKFQSTPENIKQGRWCSLCRVRKV